MQKPIHSVTEEHKKRKLIVFDLDGTLAESKADIDEQMVGLLTELLKEKKVAVIGGGQYRLFQRQLLSKLKAPKALLKNLFLFPTTSTVFYRFGPQGWRQVYAKILKPAEKKKILAAFKSTFVRLHYKHPKKTYGKVIEDRGTQITFSAVGQKAPIPAKDAWKKKNTAMKMKLASELQRALPEFEVHAAGYTSIDVTRKGIDKEYGINQIRNHLRIPLSEMIFVGDALFPGGNDSAALRTGIPCVEVFGPEDTKDVIRALL